ncbi:MAG: acyl-CoA carboxylase subunit epsilon, partial [Actinomycetota bacterium]
MGSPISEEEFFQSIEVVAGSPTAEELAAIKAVLFEAQKQQRKAAKEARSSWSKNESILRSSLVAGNG